MVLLCETAPLAASVLAAAVAPPLASAPRCHEPDDAAPGARSTSARGRVLGGNGQTAVARLKPNH
jgi:hypothetical protein